MRKAVVLVVLALAIAGSIYFLRTESPRDSAPEHASTSDPAGSEVRSDNSLGTRQNVAAWLKLRDRLKERMAAAPTSDSESGSDPNADEQEPVFDTYADLLAAAGVTPEEEAEALKWAFERGIETHSLGYEFYDRETLQALVDSGDIFALQRLADQERIQSQAETLYQQLSVDRAELDMGDFDNSRPAMIKKLERQGLDGASIRNP